MLFNDFYRYNAFSDIDPSRSHQGLELSGNKFHNFGKGLFIKNLPILQLDVRRKGDIYLNTTLNYSIVFQLLTRGVGTIKCQQVFSLPIKFIHVYLE